MDNRTGYYRGVCDAFDKLVSLSALYLAGARRADAEGKAADCVRLALRAQTTAQAADLVAGMGVKRGPAEDMIRLSGELITKHGDLLPYDG